MYITCQIGLKLKIGQTRLKSVKSDRFYEFDRFRVLTRKS
jgi:hypothetical protein